MDTIIKPPSSTKTWVLRSSHQEDILLQGELIVGREPECDICIPDHRISRKHAKIKITPAGLIVEDLNSRNGTTVNDRKINTPTLCQSGDKLKFHHMPFTAEILPPEINEVLILRSANYPDKKLEGQLVVGRDAECDVCIPNELISRKHAIITHTKLGVTVEDLGSINGTFVNEQRITSATHLKSGDSLRFHLTTFSIEEETDPDATFICLGAADPDATICAGAIVNNARSQKTPVSESKAPEPNVRQPSTRSAANQQLSAIEKQVSKSVNTVNKTLNQLKVGAWVELSDAKGNIGTFCLISIGGETGSCYTFISRNGIALVKKSRLQIELDLSNKRLKLIDKKSLLVTKLALVKGAIVEAIKG